MKLNKISTKIKIIGAVLNTIIFTLILITIYLTNNSLNDVNTVNLAGKQRMISQNIAKSIFYNYINKSNDFTNIDILIKKFEKNLQVLNSKNNNIKISKQIKNINILNYNFINKIIVQKNLMNNINKNKIPLEKNIQLIYNLNLVLLKSIDDLVQFYEENSQRKIINIKNFQYAGAFLLFVISMYSLLQLKAIERHVSDFLNYSKKLAYSDTKNSIKAVPLDAESEIVEANNSLNNFINKVNIAIMHSDESIAQIQKASSKLEGITDEFAHVLDDQNNNKSLSHKLNESEDIVIESTEELIKSRKKLFHLKDKLDNLLNECKN